MQQQAGVVGVVVGGCCWMMLLHVHLSRWARLPITCSLPPACNGAARQHASLFSAMAARPHASKAACMCCACACFWIGSS